jgi:hypothetical protein
MAAAKVVMKSSLATSYVNIEHISTVLETFHLYHQRFITLFHVYMTDGLRRFHCTHHESFSCNVKVMLAECLMIGCLVHKLEQALHQH